MSEFLRFTQFEDRYSVLLAAGGWLTIHAEEVAKIRRGDIATSDWFTHKAAAWLDEQLRKEQAARVKAAVKKKIEALWNAPEPQTFGVPPPAKPEKPHCKYHGPTPTIAAALIPARPDCSDGHAQWGKMIDETETALKQRVKHMIREWPLCSVTGQPVELFIYDDGEEFFANFDCTCGDDE